MSRVRYSEATSQVIIYVFDFPTCTRHVFIFVKGQPVEAVGNRMAFEPLINFPFLENTLNPDRDVSDLMLDCVCSGKGVGSMEILPALLEALPEIDPSTIEFGICGKKKGPGEPALYGYIGCIVIVGEVGDDKKVFISHDKIFTDEKTESTVRRLPEGYSTHGGDGRDRKAEKKAETKKADLSLVPSRAKKHLTPPKEIMDWCKAHYQRGKWKKILRGLHKFYLYRKRREDKYYPGKSERQNRQYIYGQEWLAGKLRLSRWTVGRWFRRFEGDGIIYIPYRGYKDPKKKVNRGASICELAYTDGHRKKNKRETEKRKNSPSIRCDT